MAILRSGRSTLSSTNAHVRRRNPKPEVFKPQFSKISQLPPELRLKIWQAAKPERILPLSHRRNGTITITQPIVKYSQEAWEEIKRDYVTLNANDIGTTNDLTICPPRDAIYVSNVPREEPMYEQTACSVLRKIHQLGHDCHRLVVTADFLDDEFDVNLFDLCWCARVDIVVGKAATQTRTKILTPGQPANFANYPCSEKTKDIVRDFWAFVDGQWGWNATKPEIRLCMLFDGDLPEKTIKPKKMGLIESWKNQLKSEGNIPWWME